ncbi:MAG: transporter substrate-binding domain-containing protein [Spirochaetales bacterium]|nr:transporter substrate-binding domain-containing protein [Spirochaetales bacterium]
MKRLAVFILLVCLAVSIGAQELKIGTIKGTAFYAPAFVKALKQAGIDVKIAAFDDQPSLIAALAKQEIGAAFFLAQPIIAQINGAVMVPVRLHQTNFCAVTTDPSIKINSPLDLRKHTVGIVEGNMAHTAVTRGINANVSASDMEQFRRLKAGDFEVAVAVDMLVPVMAKLTGIKKYFIGERPLLSTPTFLALAASKAALKNKIETVLKEWQDNGKWETELQQAEKNTR